MSISMNLISLKCGRCGNLVRFVKELSGEDEKMCPSCSHRLFEVMTLDESVPTSPRHDNKQQEILSYLKEYISIHGDPPSMRDIQNDLQIKSISTVYYYLNLLKNGDYLSFRQGKMHTLKLTQKAEYDFLGETSVKHLEILRKIYDYRIEWGFSPTNQELQEMLGMNSIATLGYHLNKLQTEHLIERLKYRHRSVVLTEKGLSLIGVKSEVMNR